MTKKMTKFSVTRNGKDLDPSLYNWDENTGTFSSDVNGLVLDFTGVYRVTFNTGSDCTFNTGPDCTFNTDSECTFNTGSFCTFKTGYDCTFNTGSCCTFYTSACCTFKTDSDCTFYTGPECTFNTGPHCTFNTSSDCTFNTSFNCTFKTNYGCTFEVGENCSLIRCDVKGVTEIPTGKKIKLNEHGITGYTVIEEKKETPTYNGKVVVEIDGKKYKWTEIEE
jgi:hypothetical protein